MDAAIDKLAFQLNNASPEAMRELKSVFWKGTENWDELLKERAAISGRLILSDFSKKAIADFKSK
jgi:methylglutaconyl-CoA hydratase